MWVVARGGKSKKPERERGREREAAQKQRGRKRGSYGHGMRGEEGGRAASNNPAHLHCFLISVCLT